MSSEAEPLLSVLMPVYNELATVLEAIERVRAVDMEKELVIVDDGSTDGTRELLREKVDGRLDGAMVLYHEENSGKGAALKTALSHARGSYVIVQDADLEYDPEDYHALLAPLLKGRARVVYGSRFTGEHRDMFFWHWVGNRFLTFLTNLFYNTTLSDMETCYKVFERELIQEMGIRSDRFNFEPEITARLLKRGVRIYEVPISYCGREFSEGKKITWRDGVVALGCLIKYRFVG